MAFVVSKRRLNAAVCGAATVLMAGSSYGTTLTVGAQSIGQTPTYIGYDAGNYYPGSNTTAWTAYSGVNAYRIFASASTYEPTQTGTQTGAGINSLSDFDARKAALRANPTSSTYTNWSAYQSNIQNITTPGTDELNLNTALTGLESLGITPILQMSRTPASLSSWGNQWDEWHFYYAMAYQTAATYGVSQFQMFNEPDHTDSSGTPAMAPDVWLQSMKLAADAVQSAVADVDAKYGKTLVGTISGPVTNGASGDAAYGQPAISTNRTDYGGRTVSTNVLGVYDMHRYGTSSSSFVNDVNTVRASMIANSPTHTALPITYTEFNTQTTASYAASSYTADSPEMFTGVATDVLAAMSVGVNGMYAFKFNQTPDSTVGGTAVEKTGFFYSDNTDSPYNTTGATLGGETMRLVSRAFENAQPTYAVTGSLNNYTTASSFDSASKNYYVMGVDQNTSGGSSYTLNLSSWGIIPGTVVSVEEVSTRRHGEVAQLITVPSNQQITVNQPSQSVWLLTVPSGPVSKMVTLSPTDDTQARNGTSAGGTNYTTQTDPNDVYSRVGRSATDTTGDYVSYMKFNLGSVNPTSVSRAILQVTGQVLSGPQISFHVYALTGATNNWSGSTLDWNNAPDLAGAADAQLLDVGNTAFPVGTLTYTAGQSVSGLDVTDFLDQHPESTITFAFIREQQFDGDVDSSYVRLSTSESASPPTLTLFTSVVPEPASLISMVMLAPALILRRRRQVRGC